MNALRLLRATFYDSPVGQCQLDPKGVIQEVNDALCGMTGQIRDVFIGEDVHSLLVDEARLDFDLDIIQQERHLIRKDAEPLLVELHVATIQNGDVEGYVVVFQDVSEIARLREELTRVAEELEQFAYIASHDLREPLIAVAGYSSLLQRRCPDRHEACNDCLTKINTSTKHMERKIDDLLAFSRAGRIPIEGTFPLGAALEEAKRALVSKLSNSDAKIEILNGGLPLVQGNRSMIAQVFQNLVANAIKYRKTDVVPHIQVEAHRQNNQVVVSVKDNGIGFDMRYKERIFGIFQRLYSVEQYPGTGMGLSIAKRIVERHGGRIWALSEPGQGATFFFTVPCVVEE